MQTRAYYCPYWNGEYCYFTTKSDAFSISNALFILPSFPFLILPFSRTDTFAILVFHWTYAFDLSSLYIAELEESDEEKGKEREEKDTQSEKQKLPPQSFYTVAT